MNVSIKKSVIRWFNEHSTIKQWCWFFALWLSGLLTVVILTYPIKLFIRYFS